MENPIFELMNQANNDFDDTTGIQSPIFRIMGMNDNNLYDSTGMQNSSMMNGSQNLDDMLDEMSKVMMNLQSDMTKVMTGINQLNLIITKIKQFNLNNVNNNNMINNMMNINNNMQNMAMGMQGMNMFMPMNGMMNNMNFGMQNLNQEDPEEWTLRFDKPGREKVYVKISKEKPFKEAINLYKSKSNDAQNNSFIFNANKLSPEIKICESGLKNNSYIVVISNDDIIG